MFADPPQILDVGPERVMTAPLYSQAMFICTAEGNPSPAYQWLQKLPTAEGTVLIRSSDSRLVINNVTYDYKGEYVCKATNMIGGEERRVQSDAISMQVVGKLSAFSNHNSIFLQISREKFEPGPEFEPRSFRSLALRSIIFSYLRI